MDVTYCHYHPAQPATWHCAPCQRHYSDCCIPLNAEAPEAAPQCPLCRASLNFLGAANTAQPFWQRTGQFFLYGFQTGPMAFAALLALASLFMPSRIVLWLVLFSVATKYLHSVIETSSQAQKSAPSLLTAFSGEGFLLFLKQLVVFAVAFAMLWLAADFNSEAIYWAVNIGILLVMPASIIRLALDKTLGAALSPEEVGQVIKAMGWRYLILCAFLFLLWQSPDWVTYMLSHGLPRVVLVPIAAFLFGYFSVVMCAMMGYAVFQYQGALGYAVAEEDSVPAYPVDEFLRRRALADAEILLKEGQSGQALQVLDTALRREPNDLRVNERMHQLLYALNDRASCLRHLDYYLPLVALANPALAATALLNGRRLSPDYLPGDALVCEKVAGALLDRHKPREALSLLRNLHQRCPDYPHIPRAYLLAARAFAEDLGQVDPARKLLAFIRARYPQWPQLAEVTALEQTLVKLSTSA